MCEPGKPCPTIGPVQTQYHYLWLFFDGAFSANSGGRAREEHFEDFSTADMVRAEAELRDFCGPEFCMVHPHRLGAQADSGYEVWGQTMQNEPEGIVSDDSCHRLKAFELLDTRY